MEVRYEARKHALLGECTVAPEIFDEVMPRLERFMEPFVESLVRTEQVEHVQTFMQGLLSNLGTKMRSRLPIVSARTACRCSGSWAFRRGIPTRCATSW